MSPVGLIKAENDWGELRLQHISVNCHLLYTVSQKTSPTFLAITRESIDGFL